MYARIFDSIFDSSINEQDSDVFKLWVLMLTLGGEDGIVDVTRESVRARSRFSKEVFDRAIAVLEAPDPNSRCSDHDGRRIIPLPGRAYGWQIVTAGHYGSIRTATDRKEYMRGYMKDYRAGAKKGRVNKRKRALTNVNPIDVDVDEDTTSKTFLAVGALYTALASEWDKRHLRDSTLNKLGSTIAACERDMRLEDDAFTWDELFRRIREQSAFFRDKWPRFDLHWLVRTSRGERNAAKVWAREYLDANSHTNRRAALAAHPDAPNQPGYTV